MRAAVVTPWVEATGTTPETGNHPLLYDEYDVAEAEDITGQQADAAHRVVTDPAELTVLISATPEVIAAIELDPVYTVLWAEDEEEAS